MLRSINNSIISIKNGYGAQKESIEVPYSHMIETIIKLLIKEKYVKQYRFDSKNKKKCFVIDLLYNDGKPAVCEVINISKPGRRIYASIKNVKPVLGGMGCAILTTSKGIMTDAEARKHKIGGEVLFKIW
ncbi:MAG TPA: 30S ribosomal protein S8 [Patescibacteria group bacterium]|nr:30S ribosomal protein S8 [Patescibacteria group bacterium]